MNSTVINSSDALGESHFPFVVHKYLPIACVYFFINNVGLPLGLLYTTLLAPVFYIWLIRSGAKRIALPFFLVSAPFVVAHLLLGITSRLDYLRTYTLFFLVYVCVYAFYWAIRRTRRLGTLFEQIIVLNLWMTIVALGLRYTGLRDLLWTNEAGADQFSKIIRLKLLTYEPSYLAGLLMPLLLYVLLRAELKLTTRNVLYVMAVAVPFLFSLSFGGVAVVLASIFAAQFVLLPNMSQGRKNVLAAIIGGGLILVVILSFTPLLGRAVDVLTWQDSSAQSRTVSSYLLALEIAPSKSWLWGVGFGQSKLVGTDFLQSLGLGWESAVIPNAAASVLAEFGLLGLLLRVGAEFYLFRKTRVNRNSYRLAIFIAAFFWQFTGSYVTNLSEYVMWILAFTPVFPEMDVSPPPSAIETSRV